MATVEYSRFNKSFICLIAATLVFLGGCKTNPPTSVGPPAKVFGKIIVCANVDSAMVFLDGSFTGKYTPDTLTVDLGDHTLSVVKENVSRIVLLEDFANVSCIPCVTSNKIIENLTNEAYGRSKLVAAKFATNFPSPSDPFYLANSEDCDARMSYYTIFFAPTTIIDGIERPVSTDSLDISEKVDQRLTISPRFNLNVKDSIANGNYLITINVDTVTKYFPESKDITVTSDTPVLLNFNIELDTTQIDFDNLVLHTVVTETDIEFSSPPGSNGETKFYDVMRKMLPSNAGESLSSIKQTGEGIFQRQIVINPGWNPLNLNTVVYIQNVTTKEVYQSGSTFD